MANIVGKIAHPITTIERARLELIREMTRGKDDPILDWTHYPTELGDEIQFLGQSVHMIMPTQALDKLSIDEILGRWDSRTNHMNPSMAHKIVADEYRLNWEYDPQRLECIITNPHNGNVWKIDVRGLNNWTRMDFIYNLKSHALTDFDKTIKRTPIDDWIDQWEKN